jgi:hypothetical protein
MPVFLAENLMSISLAKDDHILYYLFMNDAISHRRPPLLARVLRGNIMSKSQRLNLLKKLYVKWEEKQVADLYMDEDMKESPELTYQPNDDYFTLDDYRDIRVTMCMTDY